MASRDQLIAALRRADAAGDDAGAKRIAALIKGMSGSSAPAASPDQNEGGLYAALHGFEDTATFGLGDHAAALLATGAQGLGHLLGGDDAGITAAPRSYQENLADIRGKAAASANANPIEAGAGDVAGLFAGGGAIGAGLKGLKAVPVVGKLAEGADALLSARAGQPIANVGRAALTGGGIAAADTAAHGGNEDEILTSAAGGAVAGPILGKIGSAVARTLTPIADRLTNKLFNSGNAASLRAMRILADKIGETPASLRAAYTNFAQQTGRMPTMAEIVGLKTRGEFAQLASNNPVIGEATIGAADAAGQARGRSLAGAVQQAGGGAQDISTLVTGRTARMNAAMAPIKGTAVPVDANDLSLLTDRRVRAAVNADPVLQRKVNQTIQDINLNPNAASTHLTVDDFDAIRKALRGRQSAYANVNSTIHNPHTAESYGTLADNLTAIAHDAEPGYADALRQFGEDSDYIKAFKHGLGGKDLGEAENPALIRALGLAHGQAGYQAGTVSRLANEALGSEAGATRVAGQLSENGDVTRRLTDAVGPNAAADVQGAARLERKGAENLDAIAPRTPRAAPDDDNVGNIAHAVGSAAAHSPAGMLYHITRIFGGKLKMSDQTQRVIAKYLADPTMTQQAVNLLKKAGAQNADLRRLATAISAATGVESSRDLGP